MKFNCGPTLWYRLERRRRYLSDWHPFFALFPKRISDTECIWLETIERKGERVGRRRSHWYWSYRKVGV